VTRPLTGIPADKARSYASIEAVAAGLRQKLNLEMLERFDALDFFEKQIGDMVIIDHGKEVKMVEAIDDCPQEGMTRWDTESQRLEIVLAQRTYDMLQENHVRARSTVAHETGHAVLHTAQIIRLAGMNLKSHVAFHRDRNPHKAYLDMYRHILSERVNVVSGGSSTASCWSGSKPRQTTVLGSRLGVTDPDQVPPTTPSIPSIYKHYPTASSIVEGAEAFSEQAATSGVRQKKRESLNRRCWRLAQPRAEPVLLA
jgi:hypothetical protein